MQTIGTMQGIRGQMPNVIPNSMANAMQQGNIPPGAMNANAISMK